MAASTHPQSMDPIGTAPRSLRPSGATWVTVQELGDGSSYSPRRGPEAPPPHGMGTWKEGGRFPPSRGGLSDLRTSGKVHPEGIGGTIRVSKKRPYLKLCIFAFLSIG